MQQVTDMLETNPGPHNAVEQGPACTLTRLGVSSWCVSLAGSTHRELVAVVSRETE